MRSMTMPRGKAWLCLVMAAAFACAARPASAQGALDAFTPVTDAQLAKPPAEDWLMWRRTHDSWGYSPLKEVDAGNVARLQLVWTRGLEPGPQEGTPLVHDGVLFFPNPRDIVQAIDAATGDVLWEHRRKLPADLEKFVNAPYINRSLAIHGNLIIDTSADGYVYALDARTGKEVWNTLVVDYHAGPHQTSGPLVVDGKVITGRACEPLPDATPDACVIVAHDAATGRELWRTRTIPGPGEKGNETWGDIPFNERKHVGAWMTPSYDPELGLLYIGTSVTSPAPKFLLGGNDRKHLYHNCTLALDIATGKIVWYYQHVVDHWDMDHTFERILVDTAQAPAKEEVAWINPRLKAGEKRKVLTGIPGKTGIVYTLDRRTGEFLWARPTVQQTVVQSIDGRTGAVTVNPAATFSRKGDEASVCPSIVGGRNWPAGAYSPLTDAMYFPLQNLCTKYTVTIESRRENSAYGIRAQNSIAPGAGGVGSLQAISASTGRTLWKREQRAAFLSALTTAGGLVFSGDVAGRFRAFDQQNGAVLWEINLGSQITGFPVTFAVRGRQYVAVSTGGAVNTAAYLAMTPEIRPSNNSGLYVFALPADWRNAPSRAPVAAAPAIAAPAATPLAAAGTPPPAAQCRATDGAARHVGLERATPTEGRRLYQQEQCVTCHGDSLRGSASAPALADPGFRSAWQGRPVSALLDCLRTTMPPGRGGALADDDYLHLVSLLLDANGFRARRTEGLAGEILDAAR